MNTPSIFNRDNFHFQMNTWRLLAAVLSGLLMSSAFPPMEWDLMIWAALVPLILLPVPRNWKQRLGTGYFWGYIHYASSLLWLNEVGFGAGFLLASYCALYPMLWYALFSHGICLMQKSPSSLPPALLYCRSSRRGCLIALASAVLWVSLEWTRSWLLTGFPWNQLGISQFQRTGLIQLSAWTGVYGLSFLIILVNVILSIEGVQLFQYLKDRRHLQFPWHLALGILCFIPVLYLSRRPPVRPPENTPELLVSAIQGNIPQCRFWKEEDYLLARDIYSELSRKDFRQSPPPDLFIWPECAVPASLDYPPYSRHLEQLLKEIPAPFLIGATQNRTNPDVPEDIRVFNSVFLLKDRISMDQYYDKIHRVPFGEYVPGSRYFPRLQRWLGMGRDLTPGKNYSLFNLPKQAVAGVNICFEDTFPEISRTFTARGANLLMTLTNDAWYNESAGSRQHLSHVVFRAVENRRPLLRSGNNSDTCLISPNGKILGLPRDPDSGSPFFQCATRYRIPIFNSWGNTFYTVHGNLFAAWCNFTSLIILGCFAAAAFERHRQLLNAIRTAPDSSENTP